MDGTHEMVDATIARRSRGYWLLVAVAMVVGLAGALGACEVPAKPAAGLFDSWKGNDADGAHAFATDAAVDALFATTWSAGSDWIFVTCDGAAGAQYCNWVNRVETTLILKVSSLSKKVTEVQFVPVDSGAAGRFFHSWRRNDSATALNYSTPEAAVQLFSLSYKASDHWLPEGCGGTAGALNCNWIDRLGNVITVHYSTVTKKVTSIHFEDCGCTPGAAAAPAGAGDD